MAVRIYALAKELNVDSKELVDICTRAGVSGKGSALASLSDDEVAKVRQFMEGGEGPAPKGAPAPPPVTRPKDSGRGGRMKVIVTQPKPSQPARPEEEGPDQAPEAPQEESPAPDREAAESAESGEVAEPAKADEQDRADEDHREKLAKPGPLAGMVRKEDYIGPGAAGTKKMPVVGAKQEQQGKGGGGKKGGDSGAKRPAVRLAALPTPAQPKPEKPKQEETPTQKPDMKLPAEVLGANKLGSKPLAQHLRRAERTLEAEKIQKRTATRGGGEREDDEARGKGKGRPMLGGREQRQLNRRRGARRGDDDSPQRRISRRARRSGVNTAAPRKGLVSVQLPCTVRDLSEAAGVPAQQILRVLMREGVMTQINAPMDPDLTELVAAELGLEVEFLQPETLEDKVLRRLDETDDPEADLKPRAPVVTFLGHVDHGKTSLLDKLIGIDVAGGESGGITQHIRAYQIDKDGRNISFVDTPGHEAFTEMRARGAGVTDIAVLVVAADDGVMPQTEEAISHAKAAEVPIIVALNKIDLPGVDVNRVLGELSTAGIQPSEWGGDVEVVKTSATTGEGLDELLETILTVAELHEYKANPNRAAIGACLESTQASDQGVVTKAIVQRGTLRVGDVIVCGDAYGRVKAMSDPLNPGNRLEEAGPTVPVNLTGFDVPPPAGEPFYVLDDISQAREIAEARAVQSRAEFLGSTGFQHVTLDTLYDRLEGVEEVQTLNLILRADTRGSIEAIQKELAKLEHPEVRLRTLQATVGGVTAADVHLANASDAIILAFNVVPEDRARSLADQLGVEIRRYDVIYKITDEIRASMEGKLRPEEHEVALGRALIQQVFRISRVGSVAGCRVIQGVVQRGARARVIRDSTIIGDYPIDTLRREKDDAKEVREGYECGIKLSGFNDIKEADLLEVYKIEEVARTFES